MILKLLSITFNMHDKDYYCLQDYVNAFYLAPRAICWAAGYAMGVKSQKCMISVEELLKPYELKDIILKDDE